MGDNSTTSMRVPPGYTCSPLSEDIFHDRGKLLIVELNVLLATAFLVLIFVHGAIRRRVQVSGLATIMKGIYILTPIIITYAVGLMSNSHFIHNLFPIWAFMLVYFYGGVDTITACDLSDNEHALQYFLHILPLFGYSVLIALKIVVEVWLLIPILSVCLMAFCNSRETVKALILASRSNTKGLPRVVEPIVEYMRQRKDVPNETEADPVSMRGYRYLVLKFKDGSIITTEDIWRSQCRLLLQPNSNSHFDTRSDRLKHMALSFAWSSLLLRRFAGYPMHESSNRSTRDFVQARLLPMEPDQVEKLFRIIEVELEFVYGLFYTKYYLLATKHARYRLWRLVCIPVFLWFSFITLNKYSRINLYIKYHGHVLDVGVTRAVMVVVAALEIWQISMYFLSNLNIVVHFCEYVKNPSSSRETLIVYLWAINDYLSRSKFIGFFLKPWQRKLGQYSFIACCCKGPISRKPLSLLLGNLIKVPRFGQSGDFKVSLTTQVKSEIVSSLRTNALALSPGIATLQRHELMSKLSHTYHSETSAEIILIWHIATSACEFKYTPEGNQDQHFNVATQISRYCAHLVTFSPELLPDHPRTTERVFDKAVQEALQLFKGLNLEQRYQKMSSINQADGNNIVEKGAVLGKELMVYVMEDLSKGWRVLAEFWADLLLYMTPSSQETAHGVHLAQGGEFITHLWALLTHAGVVAQPPLPTAIV